ncbi:MAG: PAS domain S-box protein [Gammaproteobacteria bacterium]|nr:PAS domain S-box protein [Gammaproteobacteria bacterium]MBI5617421.1 PAS domain S-box protein [Gammaproteobacteria bacterium]
MSPYEGLEADREHSEIAAPRGTLSARALFDALADAAFVFTPAGIIQACNFAAERIFGHSANELVGRSMCLLFADGDAESFLYQLQNDLHAHQTHYTGTPRELRGRRKTGETFALEITVTTLRDPDGERLLGIARDITERHAAQEQIRAQNARLQRANQELEQFTYVASHDLQEPLRMVSSFTELFARRYQGIIDDTGREFIGYALDGAKRMKLLINDLLEYSRLSHDTGVHSKIDANRVCDDALKTLALAVRDSGAEVEVGKLPAITGHRAQLRVLFHQLIGNAIKYQAADRPPRIEVNALRDGNAWHFRVKDNGMGIPEEFLGRIFHIFHRLHRERRFPGTGVGLAMCKRIVELHGGTIWAESVRGEGSLFHFTLADRPPHEPFFSA